MEISDKQKEVLAHMEELVDRWVKSGNEADKKPIYKLLDSFAYQTMPYAYRNKPFLTSHKLMMYRTNPVFAHELYVKMTPSCKKSEGKFDVGIAVDRRLSYGDKDYAARFIVKNRPPQALVDEAEANDQIILSESEAAAVESCTAEFRSRHFFPDRLVKRNILFLIEGMPCKAELDHFDETVPVFGDCKTTANINNFDWKWYKLQLGFYYGLIVREMDHLMSGTDYEDFVRKLKGELYVMDKWTHFSRSDKYVFSPSMMSEQWAEILSLVQKWKQSKESGIWPWKLDFGSEDDRKVFFDCDLYPILQQYKDQMEPVHI